MRTGSGAHAHRWGLLFLAGAGTTPAVRPTPPPPPPLWREVTDSGLPSTGKTFGGVWADCDGDGALDLVLSRHGDTPEIWLDRGLRFVAPGGPAPVAWPAGLGDEHGAAACDFDGDGLWDIYVTAGADHGRGRGSNRLWRQDPPDVLADVVGPDELLADPTGRGRGALWVELDGDGVPELLVLNYATPPRLFHHRRGEAWDDWSDRLRLSRSPPGGGAATARAAWFTAAAAGDLDGDGRTDLVLAGEEFAILRGDGAGGLVDVTAACGFRPAQPPLAHLALGDVDNDGDLDLLLVCRGGQLQIWLNTPVAREAHFACGPALAALQPEGELRAALLADFDDDGVLDLYVVRQNPPGARLGNLAARGLGDGRFAPAPGWGGAPWGGSAAHGAAAIDLDHDGDLDLVLFGGDGEQVRATGAVLLYENTTTAGRGLTFELAPLPGGESHALGARVALHGRAGVQIREVQCVATPLNGSVLPLHFGVGDDPGPYRVIVDWPDGRRQEAWLPAAGRDYVLRETEPEATVRVVRQWEP